MNKMLIREKTSIWYEGAEGKYARELRSFSSAGNWLQIGEENIPTNGNIFLMRLSAQKFDFVQSVEKYIPVYMNSQVHGNAALWLRRTPRKMSTRCLPDFEKDKN